jgi:hypothetical protein
VQLNNDTSFNRRARSKPNRRQPPHHHRRRLPPNRLATSICKLQPVVPPLANKKMAPYCGHAIAEWDVVTREAYGFFERRQAENQSNDKRLIETPVLTGEVIRNTR